MSPDIAHQIKQTGVIVQTGTEGLVQTVTRATDGANYKPNSIRGTKITSNC